MTAKLARVLLTNDDGFDAPGLATLHDVARQLADDIWIVAPQLDQSGTAASLTLNNSVRCIARGDRQFAVSGTPADCVAMATACLMKDALPTVILSGVNIGGNCGDEGLLSGTLGAALTGAMLGVPSIAISMDYETRATVRWDTARAVLPDLLRDLIAAGWDRDHCLSINIPDVPADGIKGITRTRPARGNIHSLTVDRRTDLRERDYFWIYLNHNDAVTDPDSDLAALARNEISVSTITLKRGADA